jgi:hypothetical protein
MKFSMNSIFPTAQVISEHQWSAHFYQDPIDFINSGGGIGQSMPAQSVSEIIYETTYESVDPGGNGITVPVPQVTNYLGKISITMYDTDKDQKVLEAKNYLKEWMDDAHVNNSFNSIKDIARVIEIKKYSRESEGSIRTSIYMVLPPPNLTFSGSTNGSAYTFSFDVDIVQVIKLIEE